MNVYLAGKIGSKMIEIVRHNFRNDRRFSFVSSAFVTGVGKSDDGKYYCVCGGEVSFYHGQGICEECSYVFSYDGHGFQFCDSDESSHYADVFSHLINNCSALFAVIDSDKAYGTIAEIAYAAGKGIPCFAWIYKRLARVVVVDEFGNEEPFVPGIKIVDFQEFWIEFDRRKYHVTDWVAAHPDSLGPDDSPTTDVYGFVSGMCEQVRWCNDGMEGCPVHHEQCVYCCLQFFDSIIDDHPELFCPSHSTVDKCQSPIEVSFLKACHNHVLYPHCQFSIGRYFVDFAFPEDRIAIELDGHDFHKTKEQRTSDAQRQRWLELNGWRLIRFTGSEIHNNVESCVNQTIRYLEQVRNHAGN